jgi:nucleoside-diphosphate-sugar epimerase
VARVLILGGTRNLGHFTALELLAAGHDVTVLNRGVTKDELPSAVERIRADRHEPKSMRSALGSRSFDLVLDTTTYTGEEARNVIELFDGRVGRYVFISSGQVYLVRMGLVIPFRETDYEGPIMDDPVEPAERAEWLYGIGKRDAEASFANAWSAKQFPVTTLRLPMVASERDHYGRIQAYLARLDDGGPLLVPHGKVSELRHVYVADVATLMCGLVTSPVGIGSAYNISSGESTQLEDFLQLLARLANRKLEVIVVDPFQLIRAELLPHCSPFSSDWMSSLDNSRSLDELKEVGITYTPPEDYLPQIIADYETRWRQGGLVPNGYDQRARELKFAAQFT